MVLNLNINNQMMANLFRRTQASPEPDRLKKAEQNLVLSNQYSPLLDDDVDSLSILSN